MRSTLPSSKLLTLLMVLTLSACSATSTNTAPSQLGKHATFSELNTLIDQPGPIKFTKHVVANWQVPLSGLINLKHPKSKNAGLTDRQEDIHLYVYTLEHPTAGTFIVDSGISESFADPSNNQDVSFIVKSAMALDKLETLLTTKQLATIFPDIRGVLLTHIHFDHILGLTDLNSDISVYIGPGDAAQRSIQHLATQGTTDRLLRNVSVLNEWQFGADGLVDIFGDGSVWAIHTPGHTPGATAYLARAASGAHLMVGDNSHTRWGWDNQVEPGSYTDDSVLNIKALATLKKLANDHPSMQVHLGHQD